MYTQINNLKLYRDYNQNLIKNMRTKNNNNDKLALYLESIKEYLGYECI